MNTPTRISINESGGLFFDGNYNHVHTVVPSIEGITTDDVVFIAKENQTEGHGIVGAEKGQYLKRVNKMTEMGLEEFLNVENLSTGKSGIYPRKFASRVFCDPNHEFKAIAIPRVKIVKEGVTLETERSYPIVEVKNGSDIIVLNEKAEMIKVNFIDQVDVLPFEQLSNRKNPFSTIKIRRGVKQNKLDEEQFARIIGEFQNVVPEPIDPIDPELRKPGSLQTNEEVVNNNQVEEQNEEYIRKKIEEIEKEAEQLKKEMTDDELVDFQFDKRGSRMTVYEWALKRVSENVEVRTRNFYKLLGRYDTPETDRMFRERRTQHMNYFWNITSESRIKDGKIPLPVDESTYEALLDFFNDEKVKKMLNVEIVFREGNTVRIIRKTDDPCYRECRVLFLDVEAPGYMTGPNIVIGTKPMKSYGDFYDRYNKGKYRSTKTDHLVSTISHETGHMLRKHSFETFCCRVEMAEFMKQFQLLCDLKLMGVTPVHVAVTKCQLEVALSKIERAHEIEADVVSVFGSVGRAGCFIDHFSLDLEYQRDKAFIISLLTNRNIYKTSYGISPTTPVEDSLIASAIEDAKDVFNERDYQSGTHPPHSARLGYLREVYTEMTKERYHINETKGYATISAFKIIVNEEKEEEEETEGELV